MNVYKHDSKSLLSQRRFGPLFVTQFMGAFNDNVFKNALVLLITFHGSVVLGLAPAVMVQLAAGLFVLPFFLFSGTAGQLADKYEKTFLIRIIKAVEIGIAVLVTAGFVAQHVELLLGALFLMGVHSTMFGPLKYSILPQHLRPEELVAGNAWIEAGTFVAILAGSVAAGVLMSIEHRGPLLAGLTCIAVAVVGYLASRRIPAAPAAAPELRVNLNPLSESIRNIALARGNRTVFLSLLGISWFWFFGALFLSQFPPYVKDVLGGDELMATALLGTFIVGIAAGSFLCERLSGRRVELGLVPLGSIGLTLFGIDLWWASPAAASQAITLSAFLARPESWHIIFALVMLGVSGGFFTVPLYAMIQERSAPAERSRIVAANNVINAGFMVVSALLAGVGLQLGLSITELFLLAAVLNAAVALYIYMLMPEFLMRLVVWFLIRVMYRVRVKGIDQIPHEGPALIVCNHVSFVDALVIIAASRRPVRFVMDHAIFRLPILNFVFRQNRAIPIAPARESREVLKEAYDEIAAALADGDVVGIFPEGRITDSGEITAFKGGVSRILARSPVPVVPMALRGLWDSFFSRKGGPAMSKPFRRGLFNRIELVVGSPIAPEDATPPALQTAVSELRGDWR
ncbi:MFS transporter [Uliginosibacterium sp. sgz301328]|uniref:MFS transporter n=1 Tax=Uliginosibacterium sp. sgz301328 TaxID=3243764 RepID=UPI00359D8B04